MQKLAPDQALWLLTADPDTWELSDAPEWLIRECKELGLVMVGDRPDSWRKTLRGHQATESI